MGELGSRLTKSEAESFDQHIHDQIIQSGIAEKILSVLRETRGYLDPEITFGVDDCRFSIERKHATLFIVVDKPNLNPESSLERVKQNFQVSPPGKGGIFELTEEQYNLIQELAKSVSRS